jgi:ABC-type glycerol-3-phosphate transport system substrate-binding protein
VLVLFVVLSLGISAFAQQKQEVSFMTLDVTNFRPMLEEFIVEFEKANPDVDIVPIFTSELGQQAITAIESGNEPDIIFIWSEALIPYFWAKRFATIPEKLEKKMRDSMYPYAIEAVEVEGKLYGVPYNFYPSFSMIMYNVDLWKEVGIDPTTAKTWDEFMEMAQKVTKRDASGRMTQAGFSAERDAFNYFMGWLLQMGGKVFNDDGTAAFDNELGRKALQLYADIYHKWKVDDAEFGLTADEFKKGRVASTVMGPWYGSLVSKEAPEIKFGYFKQPKISEESSLAWPLFEVWTHVVSNKAQEKDGVWRFLDYLTKPDVCARWSAFSGEFSTVAETREHPDIVNSPYLGPFIEVLDFGVSTNITTSMLEEVMTALQNMCRGVAYGQFAVDEAISETAREINRIVKRFTR